MKVLILFVCTIMLIACSNDKGNAVTETAPTLNIQPAKQEDSKNEIADQPNFISAVSLYESLENGSPLFIFDARSTLSFEKSHIETALSMPYENITDEALATVNGLEISSQIVTYCGCPHHLSSLLAEQLESRGFRNVRVLYEGYWYWKDNNYPIVESLTISASDVSKLNFEGLLVKNSRPITNMDIFLKHEETGQLEAARTDSRGHFSILFHLYDYHPDDLFSIALADISEPPVQIILAKPERINKLRISL